MYYLYMLKCADSTIYTGITTDIRRRLEEHNFSRLGAKYTRARRPVELIYARRFRTRATAGREEYRVKALSRLEKQEMIRRDGRNIIKGLD